MKQLLFSFILALLPITVNSQVTENAKKAFRYKNSVQAELGGHGLYYSIIYERIIFNGQTFKTSGQAGFSYYPPQTGVIPFWLPVIINELMSFNKHHIELGLGYIFTNEQIPMGFDNYTREWGGYITGRLGYRYQKPDGKFIFRAGFTPILEYKGTSALHPLGGVSVGYSF